MAIFDFYLTRRKSLVRRKIKTGKSRGSLSRHAVSAFHSSVGILFGFSLGGGTKMDVSESARGSHQKRRKNRFSALGISGSPGDTRHGAIGSDSVTPPVRGTTPLPGAALLSSLLPSAFLSVPVSPIACQSVAHGSRAFPTAPQSNWLSDLETIGALRR